MAYQPFAGNAAYHEREENKQVQPQSEWNSYFTSRSPFGDWLKKQRHLAELSQSGLSRRTGIRQSHISHFEAGKGHPRREIADALSAGLGLNSEEVWDRICESKEVCGGKAHTGTVHLGSNIPAAMREWYNKRAEDRGVTRSRVVSEALRQYYVANREPV